MFYNSQTIDFLTERVEWAAIMQPSSNPFIPIHGTNFGGAYFKDFSQMVIAENVYATVQNPSVSAADFNAYMESLRQTNVLKVLRVVFDNEDRAYFRYCGGKRVDISGIDYSTKLQTNARLLDNLIGLQMAISMLELFLSTTRQNGAERGIKFDYRELKTELEGIVSADGTISTKGLYAKFKIELEKVKDILFPTYKRPAVYGRNPW